MAFSTMKQCTLSYCYINKCISFASSKNVTRHFKLLQLQQTVANPCLNYSSATAETLKTSDEVNSEFKSIHKTQSDRSNYEGRKERKKWRESEKSIASALQQSDPDSFGSLNSQKTKELVLEKILDELPEEEGDRIEENFVNPVTRKKRLKLIEYEKMIRELIAAKKVGEAIDVLERRMLKEDRAKPQYHTYNLLLKGCGHAGYTKKAFQLFNNMKKRGLRPTSASYTSLFNSCANSPIPEFGLKQATHLRNLMNEKSIYIEPITYHAMIKAFGRCGAIDVSFNLVDEMIEKKLPLTADTFNFLLQACISDKEAGFRHALIVWHKLRKKWITPSIFSYNLFLRTIRECGTGNHESLRQAINQIIQEGVLSPKEKREIKEISAGENKNVSVITSTESETSTVESTAQASSSDQSTENEISTAESTVQASSSDQKQIMDVASDLETCEKDLPESAENRPNLLTYRPHLGNIISIEEINSPQDRLILVGGVNGILKEMEEDGVKPTISTFGILLSIVPDTLSAERALLAVMKKYDVDFHVNFFNILIKKRSLRFDYKNARNVLTMLQEHNIEPDIMTFGALALSCRSRSDAEEMLLSMEEAGFRPNIEILGSMLRQACCQYSFGYIAYLLKYVQEEEIEPNEIFMGHLKDFHGKCIQAFKQMHSEKKSKKKNEVAGEEINIPDFFKDELFQESFTMFQQLYRSWLKTAKIPPYLHPWAEVSRKKK